MSHLTKETETTIERIISACELIAYNESTSLFRLPHGDGDVFLKLSRDPSSDTYYDFVKYQQYKLGTQCAPIVWEVCSTQEFADNFIYRKPVSFQLISERKFGQAKLHKPSELKGKKADFSVDFGKKCKCQCFVCEEDIWINHHDFFSPSWRPPDDDIGKPTTYYLKKYFGITRSDKFIYPDSWGEIVLRSEAWIVVRNIVPLLRITSAKHAKHVALKEFCKLFPSVAYSHDQAWPSFFEELTKKAKELEVVPN